MIRNGRDRGTQEGGHRALRLKSGPPVFKGYELKLPFPTDRGKRALGEGVLTVCVSPVTPHHPIPPERGSRKGEERKEMKHARISPSGLTHYATIRGRDQQHGVDTLGPTGLAEARLVPVLGRTGRKSGRNSGLAGSSGECMAADHRAAKASATEGREVVGQVGPTKARN